MERLLKDAQELSGVEYDISSYADVVDAIHVIQDNMGITGTTAKEAQFTIEGSINSMKAAWTNLLTGMADENQDFGQLVDNFVDTLLGTVDTETGERAGGVINNLMPRIQQALEGVGSLITGLAPVIGEQLPVLLDTILPAAIEALDGLLSSIAEVLPDLLTTVVQQIPNLINAVMEFIILLSNALAEAAPELVPVIVDAVVLMANTFMDNAPKFIECGAKLIGGLVEGLVASLPELLAGVASIGVKMLAEMLNWPNNVKTIGSEIVKGIWSGIKSASSWFKNNIKSWVGDVTSFLKNLFGIGSPSRVMADEVGKWIPAGVGVGITANTDAVYDAMDDLTADSTNAFNYGSVVKAASNGMSSAASGSSASGPVVSSMKAIQNDLNNLSNKLNMGIYLDGTTLVGGIANRMDSTLGRKQGLKLRGVNT